MDYKETLYYISQIGTAEFSSLPFLFPIKKTNNTSPESMKVGFSENKDEISNESILVNISLILENGDESDNFSFELPLNVFIHKANNFIEAASNLDSPTVSDFILHQLKNDIGEALKQYQETKNKNVFFHEFQEPLIQNQISVIYDYKTNKIIQAYKQIDKLDIKNRTILFSDQLMNNTNLSENCILISAIQSPTFGENLALIASSPTEEDKQAITFLNRNKIDSMNPSDFNLEEGTEYNNAIYYINMLLDKVNETGFSVTQLIEESNKPKAIVDQGFDFLDF